MRDAAAYAFAPAGRTTASVAMSMRETENEINLLVPAEIATPLFGEPAWAFAAPSDTDADDEDRPAGDELGDSTLTGKAN